MRLKLGMVGLIFSTFLSATDYGLVIGCCGEYKDKTLNSLGGTANDARAFETILLDRGCSKSNVITLINRDATRRNIKNKLSLLESQLQPGDRFYFYFSGHGARASDRKEVFFKEIEGNSDINKRLNRTAFIPYDYNHNNKYNSAIISYDDLRPVFKRLDKKGVQVVMFADACFAGQSYKRGNPSSEDRAKLIDIAMTMNTKKTKDSQLYQSLIFYGASLTKLKAREKSTIHGRRGEFTTLLELCLNSADTDKNSNGDISKIELQSCLVDEFSNYAKEVSLYPVNQLNNNSIIKAPSVLSYINDKNLIKVKYRGKANLIGVAQRVSSGYDLELVENGGEIDIYRIGRLYASINNQQLAKYLKAYRLFAFKSNNPNVKIDYRSEETGKTEDTFCANEIIRIRDKNLGNKYMTVLTLDKNGKVIILKNERDYSVLTEVFEPYGTDRIKVFTYKNQKIFNQTLAYQNENKGVLSTVDVNFLYQLLSQDPSLQAQGFEIRTTPTNIKECLKGER